MIKTIAFCFTISTLAGLTIMGCGVDDSCVKGKACECTGDCDQICGGSGAGCAFACPAGANCTFSCPGGGCSASANGATSVALDCPGDGCSLTCSAGQSCTITSCGKSCQLSCGGAATCSNSCDLFSACTKN